MIMSKLLGKNVAVIAAVVLLWIAPELLSGVKG